MINLSVIKDVLVGASKNPKVLVGVGFAGGIYSSVMAYKVVTKIKNDLNDALIYHFDEVSHNRQKSRVRTSYSSYHGRRRPNHGYNDIVFVTRREAEEILDAMIKLLSEYGYVSVSDLMDLSGIVSDFSDSRYGWTSITSSAHVLKTAHGYKLELPKPVLLGSDLEESVGKESEK